MKKNFLLLCDHAFVGDRGKLNLIGIYDEMLFPVFPAVVLKTVFVANYTVDETTEQNLVLSIELFNENKKKIEINIPPNTMSINSGKGVKKINVIIEIGNLRFDAPGMYTYILKCNNRNIGEFSLEVKKNDKITN